MVFREEEKIRKTEVDVGVGSLRMERLQVRRKVKGGGDKVVDWIWRLSNRQFEWHNA